MQARGEAKRPGIRSWKTLVDGAPISGSPGSIIRLTFTDHIEASINTGGLHVLPVSGTGNLLVTHLGTDSEEVHHRCIIGTLQNQSTSSALGIGVDHCDKNDGQNLMRHFT